MPNCSRASGDYLEPHQDRGAATSVTAFLLFGVCHYRFRSVASDDAFCIYNKIDI